jgi:hypothetical protein
MGRSEVASSGAHLDKRGEIRGRNEREDSDVRIEIGNYLYTYFVLGST